MLELINIKQDNLNTKDQIIIDFLKEGYEFLEGFDINYEIILDCISIIYRFLKNNSKVPHNLYKFFIAAYYIVFRHPQAFPAHESKKRFCKKFGIQQSSLDYSVEKLTYELNFVKILDDKNYPYYMDLKTDIGFKLAKSIVKQEVDKAMMNFLLNDQPINLQILCEELITKLVFEMNVFPEELFRQFYEIIFELIEIYLKDYYEYIELQQNFFI
ncbi:MAG: hypothetical protein ACFFDK_13310 [Promethearchaeota archaeon]